MPGVDELKFVTQGTNVSKYRSIISDAIQYFEDNPNKRVVQISCKMASEADRISKKLKEWLTDEEGLIVTRRGKIVYILRDMSGEEN